MGLSFLSMWHITIKFYQFFNPLLGKGPNGKNRLSPYKLLFFEGISGTIINLFALIPSYFIKCKNIFGICNERLYDIGETIEHMKEKEFWLFVLLLFVSSLCFNVFVRLSLHCFTPTHLNVSDALSSVMYWGYVKLFEQSKISQINL